MAWLRYSGIISVKKKDRKKVKEAIEDFPVPEFFLECGGFFLIDGIYPDVRGELRLLLEKLKEEKVGLKGGIEIGACLCRHLPTGTQWQAGGRQAAHMRDVSDWANEEIRL